MEQSVIDVFFALLRFEIKGMRLCENVKNNITAETLTELYKMAKRHDLAHLIGDALDKNGLLPEESEAKKRFFQERNIAVYRCEQLRYELGCICDTLEKVNIPFIPLKGSVLRPLYPEPWMRTSCDIDVLVKEADLEAAISVLEEKLQYKCTEIGQHDAQIFSKSGVHIELHYSLLESGSKMATKSVLNGVWESVDKTKVHCTMPDELLYCYLMSHIAKHIKFGGCGIRPFIDIWILNNQVSFNAKEREQLLKKADLWVLSQAIEKLASVWLDGERSDELSIKLEQYILTGGIYGTFENKVAAQRTRKKSKIAYLLSRIFLPYHQMKFKYTILQKHPILYPFYIIKRCFLLLKKDKRKLALREVEQTVHGGQKQHVAKLLSDLDI